MWSQQIFVAVFLACLTFQQGDAVVNNGQNKKLEDSAKITSDSNEKEKSNSDTNDLVAESSATASRREAPAVHDTYGTPSLVSSGSGHISLPPPVYGVPSAPSNNVIYPAPPPDIPPPPPRTFPPSIYGVPTLGKVYGVPQINQPATIPKGYGPPPIKYGSPSFSLNQFSSNLSPPKPVYGPPKISYGVPGKPIKYNKYPSKNYAIKPPKPVYGAPFTFKENFSYNKLNNHANSFSNFYTSNTFPSYAISSPSNLYSGISGNHQYGAPILPPKPAIFFQYGSPNLGISTQYGLPDKTIAQDTSSFAYGPPQPSSNPKPPHPGAPAPPTPPDIKYDGWHPIPGLVSKPPVEEIHHLTAEGSGYNDLSPPHLDTAHNQISSSYGAPPVTLDISHGNSLLDKPGLSDSYGVPLNSVTGSKGLSDSYSAPLGTVTGSGGVVQSSGAEAHEAGSISQSTSHGSFNSLSLDLTSIGQGHGSDIQAVKSVEYDISPDVSETKGTSTLQISSSYGAPHAGSLSSSNSYASNHQYNSFGASGNYKNSYSSQGHKSSTSSNTAIGLVPPSGIYGAPPSSQYGTPLHTNTHSNYNKDVSSFSGSLGSSSYLPPTRPIPPSTAYGIPKSTTVISFQNVAHGSSSAGIDIQHNTLNIEGASALPLEGYNVPLGNTGSSYTLPSSTDDFSVSLDYSHPPVTIDLTKGNQVSLPHDCYNKQNLPVPSLAYGVPSVDSYTSSLSSLTTNIGTSQTQTIVPQPTFGIQGLVAPQSQSVSSSQYGVLDLQHSSSTNTEAKVNSIEQNDEAHGKSYGQSVAATFGPNSELVESQSIDLNSIPLQGNLGSYTLQIQSSDGTAGQVPHAQVLNEGLLQSIIQAIEGPGKRGEDGKYPIVLQPSMNGYSINETLNELSEPQQQESEIREVIAEAPEDSKFDEKNDESLDNEETLQLLDTSNIALYFKKDSDVKKVDTEKKIEDNSVDNGNS